MLTGGGARTATTTATTAAASATMEGSLGVAATEGAAAMEGVVVGVDGAGLERLAFI